MSAWTASRNQNLLHPDTAPVARELEAIVVRWLAPWFGMNGGHLVSGSTVANLTALWAARRRGRFGADYLEVPSMGVAGSHGAAVVPLLATLVAYGRAGVAGWIETCMDAAEELHRRICRPSGPGGLCGPATGVLCWRHRRVAADAIRDPVARRVRVPGVDRRRALAALGRRQPPVDVATVFDAVLAAAEAARSS